jgi:hypothetical protein
MSADPIHAIRETTLADDGSRIATIRVGVDRSRDDLPRIIGFFGLDPEISTFVYAEDWPSLRDDVERLLAIKNQ